MSVHKMGQATKYHNAKKCFLKSFSQEIYSFWVMMTHTLKKAMGILLSAAYTIDLGLSMRKTKDQGYWTWLNLKGKEGSLRAET